MENTQTIDADLVNVSLRSFNQKIGAYEIALKYSKELKDYDNVDRLTIELAALRLVKRMFFTNNESP